MIRRGQALVEFALVVPLLFFVLIGAAEMGMLYAERVAQDRATAVVAEHAADRPGDESWRAVAAEELPGCDVDVTTTALDVVHAEATCTYSPKVSANLWDGLPISTEAVAAVRGEVVGATATPEPSGSVAP